MLEDAGKIVDLELQRKFILQHGFKLNGKTYRSITYVADFVIKIHMDKYTWLILKDIGQKCTKLRKNYS